MRIIARSSFALGLAAAIALIASSAADARHLHTTRFGGARNSVSARSAPSTPGGVSYGAEIAPFPTGHGGNSASPDFQMIK
jgi:hypothetical protein